MSMIPQGNLDLLHDECVDLRPFVAGICRAVIEENRELRAELDALRTAARAVSMGLAKRGKYVEFCRVRWDDIEELARLLGDKP